MDPDERQGTHEMAETGTHTLHVFNAVDVPDDVAFKVLDLLRAYDVDVYTRDCDASGRAR